MKRVLRVGLIVAPLLAIGIGLFAIFTPLTGCERLPGTAPPAAEAIPEVSGLRFIERITGGARASDPLPLIVAMHGHSGRPEKMARNFVEFGVRARVIMPYGPYPAEDGFAWFEQGPGEGFADGARAAADRVSAMIAEITHRRPTVGKPIVMGFSQGAIVTYTLAVLHPNQVGAAFPLSGFLPPRLYPTAWPPGAPKPPVHAFHGTADRVVPVAGDRASIERLREVGVQAELTLYEGLGHAVDADEQRDVARAIEKAIGGR